MTSSKKVVATARVTLTIEVSGNGTWGNGCDMVQVYKQAAESAVGFIQNVLPGRVPEARRLQIIGEPKVTAVLVEEDK